MIEVKCTKKEGPNGKVGVALKIKCEGTGTDIAIEAASILFHLPSKIAEEDERLGKAITHNFKMMADGLDEEADDELIN